MLNIHLISFIHKIQIIYFKAVNRTVKVAGKRFRSQKNNYLIIIINNL